jgi:putative flippase GtrA
VDSGNACCSADSAMGAEASIESSRRAFLRFGLSGIVFTILGPALFWLNYPLGPFVAIALAEFTVHVLRFATFKKLVFPARKGYKVSLARYVVSALPISCAGFASVALLRDHLDRASLTLVGVLISLLVGFVWSRFVYSQPVMRKENLRPGGRAGGTNDVLR